jgi:hypothetical protein
MGNWNGFGDLDLSTVETGGDYVRLQPGEYTVKCVDAKVEQIEGTNNRKVVADFKQVDGKGEIRFNFNVYHSNEQAMEIGQRQLKSFLMAGGHSNPDKPGDISTLKGLTVNVIVGMGKPWRDRNGNERQSTEIKRFSAAGEAAPAPKDPDDKIPF